MSDNAVRGEMPFLDHLEELRWRILWSLLAVAIGTAVGWLLVNRLDVITLLKRPIAPFLPGGQLMFTSPTEPFLLTLKVSFAVGCLLASPIVIYQVWAFLAPALYPREKRLIVPALGVGVILFLIGATAAYLWALPAALEVLFGFTRDDLAPVITIDRYFGFAIPFILAFGVVTELPLVIAILAALGLVTPQFLRRHRRYAIVLAAVLAALLTPPDAVSMAMMLVPLLLLYEISIACAWVASRRRGRRIAGTLVVLALVGGGGGGGLAAQQPVRPPPRDTVRTDTARARPDTARGAPVDTATARRLGLPTGPTRSFPAADPVMDSLLQLQGFRITRYVADTLIMEGDSLTIFLRGEAYVEREGTQLEADSIRYREESCRLDAAGDPRLFDQGTVLVGEGMRYNTCIRRGTVNRALTKVDQGGTDWIVRGNLAVDSGQTRVYAGGATFTSDQQPVPDYHFAAGEVKWINKNVMVARPAVLYVRDVPVMWLPFIFQDIRSGRRSGILVPRFGLNDLVRPSRGYSRHITNFGYYFALNDYVDLLVSGDWYSGRTLAMRAQSRYRWLDRFMQGGLSYTRTQELDLGSTASRVGWFHNQTFNARTRLNAMLDYATSATVVSRNSLDPLQATATLASRASFDKRFAWGTLNLGGSRTQELSNDRVTQSFPEIRLTPSAVNLTPAITWSPLFTYTNTQTFHSPAGTLVVPGQPGGAPLDTVPVFADDRRTTIQFQTPLRIGRWNWSNGISIVDVVSNRREEFLIPDSADPTGVRRVLFARTFRTDVDWQTGINLPPLFSGTWKLQPGLAILNTTSAGPFMLKNQFSGGEFVRQGKRLAFTAGMSPTFFGFFPGVGPLLRIRHAVSPIISYQYAPGARVPEDYARALDPTGRTLNARSDPQQTISLSLSQNIEAKLRPPAGDTAAEAQPRKIRLISINTSGVSYNFEQARQPGRVGWQTQSLDNTFASDLLPGFSLRLSHDLWRGQVGLDTTRFDPFLQSVSTSFSVSAATLRGIGGLLGLGGGTPPPPLAAAPPDTGDPLPGARTDLFREYQGATPRDAFGGTLGSPYGGGGGGGRGFTMNVAYSSTRRRDDEPSLSSLGGTSGGRQVVTLNLSFAPTRNWTASWYTSYDFDTRQFAQHNVRLERDLHRWRASFQFAKSGNGNFVFSFNIALIDQSDIKFDYDQTTLVRP